MAVAAPLRAVPDLLEPRQRFRVVRARCVRRTRLLRRLAAAKGPLVVLAAPAGYGKTALLQQWDDADHRPFVWLSAAAAERDPVQLLGAAADRVDAPAVVVLDDAHLIQDRAALDVLRGLIECTAPGSLLVLASRGDAVPLGRARASGLVTELGPAELAMTDTEAATFLRREGLELTFAETERIIALAQGWPAGLRLAALSLREQDDPTLAVARFAGDDRIVADYVRDELLSDLGADAVTFLTRTSPLEWLTGPLCDAVLATEGSGRMLRRLAHANVLITAVDRTEEHFRVHPLLAGMLRGELRRDEPGREREVHLRAGAWHERRGELEAAVDHLTAAGDAAAAGRLLWRLAPAYAADGRGEDLQRRLDGFGDDELAAHAPLALTAALRCVAAGDRDAAQRWAEAAERAPAVDDPSLAAGLALVCAAIARDGAVRMGEDAARAMTLAGPDGPLRASACLLAGIAHRMTGEREQARALLDEAALRSREGASTVHALSLAQLALLTLDEGDRDRALELAGRARDAVTNAEDPGCGPAFAAAALTEALDGRVAQARLDVDAARRLMPRQVASAPWAAAELRVVLARAELRLSDAAAARDLLTEAARLARATPDATALHAAIEDAWEAADTFAAGAVAGPTSLTTAELRVLRFLPSHLSFREIAARLHVSANTVKSQAHAVYRKLDASSRSEAVARARDVGLVDG